MSRKKTHQGVEMRSTFGMKKKESGKKWFVVADQSQGKIFEWRSQEQDLIPIKSWKFPMGKMKGSDWVSDKPGRVFESKTFARGGHQTGAPRHGYTSQKTPHQQLAFVFTKKISDWLEKESVRNPEVEFVFVAPPQLMGLFRKHLSHESPSRFSRKWSKDFHWLSEAEMKRRLVNWMIGVEGGKERVLPRRIGAFGYNRRGASAYGR